jgi:hypothetical protein
VWLSSSQVQAGLLGPLRILLHVPKLPCGLWWGELKLYPWDGEEGKRLSQRQKLMLVLPSSPPFFKPEAEAQ